MPLIAENTGDAFSTFVSLLAGYIIFMVLFNFMMAVGVGPGFVHASHVTEDMQRRLDFDPNLRRGERRRFCARCECVKPFRVMLCEHSSLRIPPNAVAPLSLARFSTLSISPAAHWLCVGSPPMLRVIRPLSFFLLNCMTLGLLSSQTIASVLSPNAFLFFFCLLSTWHLAFVVPVPHGSHPYSRFNVALFLSLI